MHIRVTLSHEVEGTLVISLPDGWKEAEINFERHPDLHCVRPKFNTPFDFYGTNTIIGVNGGRDFILKVEKNHGPDAIIGVLVERSQDGFTWKILAEQEFPISGPFADKVGEDHRVESTLTDKSFWAKFMSRFETTVNINSTTNEDGEAATVHTPVDLTLTSQTIQKRYYAEEALGETLLIFAADGFFQFSPNKQVLDEIDQSFGMGFVWTSTVPSWFMEIKEAGEYALSFQVCLSGSNVFAPGMAPADPRDQFSVLHNLSDNFWNLYFQLNNDTPQIFTMTSVLFVGTALASSGYEKYTFSTNLTLKVGDILRVYGQEVVNIVTKLAVWGTEGSVFKNTGDTEDTAVPNATDEDIPTFFDIVGQTTFPNTEVQSDLIHDTGAKISDRITGVNDSFYSEVLGSQYTVARTYAEAGAYWEYANNQGLQVRGYTLTEKPFFTSMRAYWQGINPCFNLGMGIKKIAGIEKIYIGKKEEFYPTDRVSVRLSGVYKITRSYDGDHQFNLIETGYEKGEIEDVSGLDDWLRVNRSTRFKKIGKKLPNLSKMIGSALPWEQARRTTKIKSADYKYDNDTFIVNVKRQEDGSYRPAIDEEFDAVTNLLNEDTRYNKKLTPGRNFLRWINYYSGCLQAYLTSAFRFAGGAGNFDMTSEMIDNGDVEAFGGAVLSEKQDIPVSSDYLFLPMPYKIEHYVTFSQLEAMLADPEAAIEISQTQAGHKLFFIKNVSVQMSNGKITGELWPKEFMDLQVVSKPGRIFSDEFDQPFG